MANAIDDVTRMERARMVADEFEQLSRLGFEVGELDLRAHFTPSMPIDPVIDAADLLWVIGGNTFTLCRAFQASSAVRAVRQAVTRGLLYAGYSAGAVAAGPDLVAIDLVDDASTQPVGYPPGSEPSTLRLVPERVIPHADPHAVESGIMAPVVRRLQEGRHEHLLLRDGQALVVRGASRWIESD